MGILETWIKESTKKVAVKVLGDTVERVARTTTDTVNKYKENHIEKEYSFVPFRYDEYSGRNYKDVMEELSAYGFNNIALFPKKDLIKGWLIKDGEVENIMINGKEKFKKNQRFESNVRVVITYHTLKNK